jgi:uncharacterized protein GlcG (DUF336 family)
MALKTEKALDLIRAVLHAAREKNVSIAVAVVGPEGRVLAAARSEEGGFINLDIATKKAATAANFKTPTHALMQLVDSDAFLRDAVLSEPDLCILPGGIPLIEHGVLVGALGIAGSHYSEDQAIGEQTLESHVS